MENKPFASIGKCIAAILCICALLLTVCIILRGNGEYVLEYAPSDKCFLLTNTKNNTIAGPFMLGIQPNRTSYILGQEPADCFYTVSFKDVSVLPGRYSLSVGTTRIDIMEARVVVDGKSLPWRPAE